MTNRYYHQRLSRRNVVFILFTAFLMFTAFEAQAQTVMNGPAGSNAYGSSITYLPNGNFVVTDPYFSSGVSQIGAVYLYGPSGTLISRMTGGLSGDRIGDIVTVLSNSDFVVSSTQWNSPTGGVPDRVAIVGAVTKCSGTTGCPAQVTTANSLTGSTNNDAIGLYVTSIGNGNYVVGSPSWRPNDSLTNVGASTFCNGTTNGCAGKTISAANSLVGSASNDYMGVFNVTILTNGDYVTFSKFQNGTVNAGAVTRCPASGGCTGTVTLANSLTGGGSGVGGGLGSIIPLPNNKFLVATSYWSPDVNQPGGQGAVTLCDNNTNNCMGHQLSAAMSLVGSSPGDAIGSARDGTNPDIWVLPSGDYVVGSPTWDLPGDTPVEDAGALTLCRAATNSCAGQAMSTSNSLTGNVKFSHVGVHGVTVLANGNYVVASSDWRPSFTDQSLGAVTLCVTSSNSCSGVVVSPSNSLVGSTINDQVGGLNINSSAIAALPNGGYVVSSPNWSRDYNNGVVQVGAVTMCPAAGCVGQVSTSNSLTGTNPSDNVGSSGSTVLTDGSFVVNSPYWPYEVNGYDSRLGAATLCRSTNSCAGQTISAANSLIGSKHGDQIGLNRTVALSNGNYVVVSAGYDQSPSVTDVGAVTFCTGAGSCVGQTVSAANSLVGSTTYDYVGWEGTSGNQENHVTALPNGNYVVRTPTWHNGAVIDAGAITIGNGTVGTVGPVSSANSIVGAIQSEGQSLFAVADASGSKILVSLKQENKIVRIGPGASRATPFDFDGDGKADASVFRPSDNVWYLQRSTAGFTGFQFGAAGDKLVPADFTGDGKTDLGVWRPSNGAWYVMRSDDNTFYGYQFGSNGDIPAPGDFDGDGKADFAVFRPSSGTWFLQQTTAGFAAQPFGANGDYPTVGDYDGDGKSDFAVYRPSEGNWYRLNSGSGNSFSGFHFGAAGDQVVPADYTGDGKTDMAIFRPSQNAWFIMRSEDLSFYSIPFGASGDVPVPGDYDGDGKADPAVWRAGTPAYFFVQQSTAGFAAIPFGTTGDKPIENAYVY